MKIAITIMVDAADLDVEYTARGNSLTSEYWGSVRTDEWVEIEIEDVGFNGYEAELDNENWDRLETYLAENQ